MSSCTRTHLWGHSEGYPTQPLFLLPFISLVLGPTSFFILQFALTIVHGSSSASVYNGQCKLKSEKWGRPGNEASLLYSKCQQLYMGEQGL